MDDHKVRYRSDTEIASIAAEVRKRAGVDHKTRFSVAEIIRKLEHTPLGTKGKLTIVYMSRSTKLPRVMFTPHLLLHVHKEMLEHSDLGDPHSQYVLSHELAHLVMHDHHAQKFSNDPAVRIKSFEKEESAEWQANRFAYHFLVPNKWVHKFINAEVIAEVCCAPMQVAIERVAEVATQKKLSELCSKCYGGSVEYSSGSFVCFECGHKQQ